MGDRLDCATPVRRIERGNDGVTVISDALTVNARYVIVTAPPVIAAQIHYDPPLPAAHSQLLLKMVPSAIWKFVTFYDTPFWHAQGLSGQTTAPRSPVSVSIEASPMAAQDGKPPCGEMMCSAVGKSAIALDRMNPEDWQRLVLASQAMVACQAVVACWGVVAS